MISVQDIIQKKEIRVRKVRVGDSFLVEAVV